MVLVPKVIFPANVMPSDKHNTESFHCIHKKPSNEAFFYITRKTNS